MFLRDIKRFSREFIEKMEEGKKVRVITHLDADGLSSGAIISKLLEDLGIEFHLSVFKQIYKENIDKIGRNYDVYLFLDLGSGKLEEIERYLNGRDIFILDHHKPSKEEVPENIRLINPFLYGMDGDKEITSSGISYLFSREIHPNIFDIGTIAISGMFGDAQDPEEGLNKEITEELIEKGFIEIKRGLRVFGRTYKPIHKALAYSFDPFLPGITGSEEEALKIIKASGIEYKIGNYYKTISDLSEEEERELISNIIIRAIEEGKRINPKEIIGKIFLRKGKAGLLSDLREIATLLNAFGRLQKGSLAILLLLGKVSEDIAYKTLEDYSKVISKILRDIDEGRIKVEERERFVIIHGEDKIPEELIGTITSILSKNYPEKILFGYSLSEDGYYKVSLRCQNEDCREIIERISKNFEIEGGGHKQAGGMKVKREDIKRILDNLE